MRYLKANILALGFILATSLLFAQSEEEPIPIVVKGKIVDKFTQDPLMSRIKYESLPYGSKIGVFKGETFKFTMENGKDYAIKVECDGYTSFFATLKSGEANNHEIERL